MLQNVSKYYKNIIYISIISSLTLIIYLYNVNSKSRNQFENFLLSQNNFIPDYSDSELSQIPKPEHPHMGTFQNNFMTLDPELGYVPSNRLKEAFIETRRIQNNHQGERLINWSNINSNMGGRTRAIMYDPNSANFQKVWAGGVSGGLWYNNDIYNLNSLWEPVNDFWDNLSVTAIVYDPNNSNIFYVTTGEANTAIVTYRESSARGVGIWKTIDGGQNWELLESTFDFEYITDIAIKNNLGTSEIYASVASGTYQGQDHQSQPSDGLYKSIDGGLSWEQVLPNIIGLDVPYTPSDIEISSSGKIFVGTMKNLEGEGGATILSSTTGSIDSWEVNQDYKLLIETDNSYNIPGRVILSSCKNNPNYIYAIIGSGYINNMGFNLSYGNYMIKSVDNGYNWSQINLPANEGNEWASLAWHALGLKVHPDNPSIVFAGGLELYRTINGGDSWNDLSEWNLMYSGGGDRYIHADIHQIVFQPDNANNFLVTSDGGIFLTNNSLDNWEDIIFIERNQGYNTLQFYTCDVASLEDGNLFVGGLQDNGTLISDLNESYENNLDINDMITGGDGAFCFYDMNDPLLITSTYYNAWYFINYYENTFNYLNNSSGVFINPADYDTENNVLYANKVRFNGGQSNRIIKIDNINPESFSNSDDIDLTTINLNTNSTVYFSAIKVSPFSESNSTNLFLGTLSGRLFKVENVNNNPSVNEIGSNSFPFGNISSIDIGQNENEIFITFSNYGVSSIWMTYDGGDTWLEKENNLPDMPVRWGILHPDDSNYAMIATEIGVWETSNLSNQEVSWIPSSNGFANVRVDMLSIREEDNMVIAASHGRGLFYGVFNLNSTLLGDLNYDEIINVLDIVLLVNLVLGNSEYLNIADLNNDQVNNVLDIVILVNNVLGS